MDQTTPIATLAPYRGGEGLSASKLNKTVDAINRASNGVKPPQQVRRTPPNSGASSLPVYCRSVVTDTAVVLSGQQDNDGISLVVGDYVLVSRDQDDDGVYLVKLGAWYRAAKLSINHGTDKVSVFPKGTLISIWDGDSAGQAYMACIDETLEV